MSPLDSRIAPNVIARVKDYAAAFARREPFRHVIIDNFFEPDYVAKLLDGFPAFERGSAKNEAGAKGGKSTVERVRTLGSHYSDLDDLVRSSTFLDLISRITAIPALLYDRYYFGGGTHENRDGQELDPHVDFNRHPINGWHRRLNLIVYLNREWDDAWGGALELHKDPRSEDDRTTRTAPLFNRCVIFETTESSWHGFERIALPAQSPDLSRKSIALYFYTRERPAEEPAKSHATIYVDRPLPPHLVAGAVLTEEDMRRLRESLARRDQHSQRLYHELTELRQRLDLAESMLRRGPVGRLSYLARRVLFALRRR